LTESRGAGTEELAQTELSDADLNVARIDPRAGVAVREDA
jgi:hypothetical protein